jgi:HPt (histidine-containing phosphotransfer) domain-containing protein
LGYGGVIVALTANAVAGMKEMFIEKGFNDFLAKPIDVSKLDETLARWIPKEKREQGVGSRDFDLKSVSVAGNQYCNSNNDSQLPTPYSLLPTIPSLDMSKGIAMTGGTMNAYRQVLSLFREDAEERLLLLQTAPEPEALTAFVTQVHALKSASASIGAAELSAQAAALEAAGKAADFAFIDKNLTVFAGRLAELAVGIRVWEEDMKKLDSEKPAAADNPDHETVMLLLQELAEALKSQKGDVIDRILEQITQQPLDTGIKTAVDKIADEVLMAEYEKAWEILDSLLKGENNN